MAFMIESNLYGSHCMFCNKKISKIFKGNALLYDNMFSFLQEYTKENNCRTTIHFLSRLWKFIYTAFFEIRHAHYTETLHRNIRNQKIYAINMCRNKRILPSHIFLKWSYKFVVHYFSRLFA